jgi:hypothetical protein
MSEPMDDRSIEWFDGSTSWRWTVRRAVFFGGYCGRPTVVRWSPRYHHWKVGFRKVAGHA